MSIEENEALSGQSSNVVYFTFNGRKYVPEEVNNDEDTEDSFREAVYKRCKEIAAETKGDLTVILEMVFNDVFYSIFCHNIHVRPLEGVNTETIANQVIDIDSWNKIWDNMRRIRVSHFSQYEKKSV